MKNIYKIENSIRDRIKFLPDLPKKWQKWIADNIWWIVYVGAVLSAISALMFLFALASFYSPSIYHMYYVPKGYNNLSFIMVFASLVFSTANMVLMTLAIKPLKKFQLKGWEFLFLAVLLNILTTIVNVLIDYGYSTITTLLAGVINLLVGSYILFQIKGYFIKK